MIPDAPWIRDAETNGPGCAPDVYCPICGEENPEAFYIQDNDVIGCSCCVRTADPWEWEADHEDTTCRAGE